MGTAKQRSWSYSQQRTYEFCPRAYFYSYYPWGEPEQEIARYLSKGTTPELLAGLTVHNAISLWLRQFKQSGDVPSGTVDRAVGNYWRAVEESKAFMKAIDKRRKPPEVEYVLDQHIYRIEGTHRLEAGEQTVRTCLKNFSESVVWTVIQNARVRKSWLPVENDSSHGRFIVASPRLGLTEAEGLRIYTPFDFGLEDEGHLYLVDWKTGKQSPKRSAELQLAGYALWGLDDGFRLDQIHSQAVWLGSSCSRWSLEPVSPDHVEAVKEEILAFDAKQRVLVKRESNAILEFGRGVTFRAEKEDFPMTSDSQKCLGCKYRLLCHPTGFNDLKVA